MRYVKILFFFLLANILNAEVKYEKGKVIFIMEAPEANKVVVTGTFLNWNPQGIEMEKRDGSWFAEIELKPGEYEYKFIVDGTWVEDPDNPRKVPDGFGGFNSEFELTEDGKIITVGKLKTPSPKAIKTSWRGPEYTPKGVLFRFYAPDANRVFLAGTFNNWAPDALPMQKDENGIFSVKIKLHPGTYQYKFVIEGTTWKEDPTNPAKVDDGFGGFNSVFKLTEEGKIILESPKQQKLSDEPVINQLKPLGTPLYLAIVWHQHQPRYYKDLKTGESFAPWVRLHGIKDYYDMVSILEKYPDIHFTVNLTPVLLMQLEDEIKLYEEGKSPDVCVRMTLKNADSLTYEDKKYLLENFFSANWDNMIDIWPRYKELRLKRVFTTSGSIDFDASIKKFTTQDWRDLQVWFNLAWFDPDFQEGDVKLPTRETVSVKKFIDKGRNFSEKDKREIIDIQFKILKAIIPEHRKLQEIGQIEVITTPYFHPILPLIYNTDLAKEAMPLTPLPPKFSYPKDAEWHVKKAVEKYEKIFGRKPVGMWPAEGAVAQATVPIVSKAGFRWMASDAGVLSRSLNQGLLQEDDLYRPYKVITGKDTLYMVFRDTDLSDRIGFRYKSFTGVQAANDFILRLYEIHKKFANSNEPHLVTVILDGENAWEWYKHDAKEFFHSFYSQLSQAKWIKTVKVSEFLEKYPPKRIITHLFAGSWINADFSTWIGEPEENMAWDYLGKVRKDYKKAKLSGKYPAGVLKKAFHELTSAEGSDWFWFFGNDQNAPGGDKWTDVMFRRTLKNVYEILGKPYPAYLDSSILIGAISYVSPEGGIMARSTPVLNAKLIKEIKDPAADDYGPGTYTYPRNPVFKKGLFDILSVRIYETAHKYYFGIKFPVFDNPWQAPLGFSHKFIQLYIDYKEGGNNKTPLKTLGVSFESPWDLCIFTSGWNDALGVYNASFNRLSTPEVYLDKKNRELLMGIEKSLIKLKEAKLYLVVTSYDGYGEEKMRKVTISGGEWEFGGAEKEPAPKVIDVLYPEADIQEDILSSYTKGEIPKLKPVEIR